MGELINFQIRKNKKIIACCYYRWYFGVIDPLQRAFDFINYWDNPKYMDTRINPKHIIIPDELACVAIFQKDKAFSWEYLCTVGSGLHLVSYEYMTKKYDMFDFPKAVSQGLGVICVTENEINKAINNIKRQVIIDLDYRKVICENIAYYISVANFIIHIQNKRPFLKTPDSLYISCNNQFTIGFEKLKEAIEGYKKKKGIYKCDNGDNIITF